MDGKNYTVKGQIVVETINQWARIKGIEIIEGHAIARSQQQKGQLVPETPL